MGAPRWLKGFWAKTGAKAFRGRTPRTEAPREMCPALLDERWLAAAGLVDHPGAPFNAKGLHEVMMAVDAQPYALWKMFVARLIATARRFSKDLHEQSIYVQALQAEMEQGAAEAKFAIKALAKAREDDAREAKTNAKTAKEQIDTLLAERVDLMERLGKAQRAEEEMVAQVRAANEFRESMKQFTEKASGGVSQEGT